MSNANTAGRRMVAGALTLVGSLWMGACTDWAGYDIDKAYDAVPVIGTMRNSVIPDYQEHPRLPAPGSVPVQSGNGDIPAPYTSAQLDSVAPTLQNPLAGGANQAALVRGQQVYTNNCSVCHGPAGAGDGPVVGGGKFPFAPPLNGGTAVGRSDGYIYAVVEVGRGLMPPYGERITHMDRWAVVEYVRVLQRNAGATGTAAPNPGGSVAAPPPAQVQGQLPAAARDSQAPLNAPAPAAQPAGPR